MKTKSDIIKGTQNRTILFLIGLIAITLTSIIATSFICSDDYFMIANWKEFLQNGFYSHDPLSMHHEYRCSLEKWLSCAVLYYLYHNGSIVLLRIVLTVLCIIIVMLEYRLCFYISNNQVISLAFTELILFTGSFFLEFRPQTVTILLLIIETMILEHVAKDNNYKLLFFLPIISWFEMQFHSTIWPCFFMVLLPYIFDFHFENRKVIINKYRSIKLCLTAAACFGSLFLNPYGAWSVFYIFRSYGDPYMKAAIGELQSTTFFWNGVWEIWFILIIIAFIFGDKKLPFRYYLICFGFYFFAWSAVRNQIFFDFIGSIVLCYMLRNTEISLHWNLVPVIPIIAAALSVFYFTSYVKQYNPLEDRGQSYVEVLDKLASTYGVNGENIYCDSEAGSYAEFLGYHPYVDSRAEVYLKKVNGVENSWHEYVLLQINSINYMDFLKGKDFNYLVVNSYVTPDFYEELMQDDNYQMVIKENNYGVFIPTSVASQSFFELMYATIN